MKSKSFIIAVMASMAALSSCQKESYEVNTAENDSVMLSVSLGGDVLETRATGVKESDEKKVNNIQVYVLDSSGAVESYKSATGSSLTVNTTTGSKKIYALVNCPEQSGVVSETALLALVSQLQSNSKDSFEMVGSLEKTITATDLSAVVPVKRLVAKVSIGKISANFSSAAYSSATFIVKAIYLINVAGDVNYGNDSTPTVWFNKSKYTSGAADALLYDGGLNKTITSSSPYSTQHSFYCYPNKASSDANGGTWSARHTRLVIETTLGGKTYYYPLTMPVIERNKTYTVSELVVTRPGSTDPDSPVSTSACQYSVEVDDWETGLEPYVETI